MKKILSLLLGLSIFFNVIIVSADESEDINTLINNVGNYIYETVPSPQVGSTYGEWAVIGLARGETDVDDEYFVKYRSAVEEYVTERGGILSGTKYTEYSRLILALTAIGKNPENVGGYNLLLPLGDYEKTVQQGINGSIWALIALDSNGYEIPDNPNAKVRATRELYIEHILKNQLSNGGWALSGDIADPDITGMALQALSGYRDNPAVKSAIEKALTLMSEVQNADGGYSDTSESCAQMAVALCSLGIPLEDARFVKNGNTMLDNLLSYYDDGKGFKHTKDASDTNQMATEQCFYTLVAIKRLYDGQNSLYDMSDATPLADADEIRGLDAKHADVAVPQIVYPGKTFDDIINHECKTAAEALACRNIINGKTQTEFFPDDTMSRAEFAAITVRALGLPSKNGTCFDDVDENAWYASYITTAYSYGIINGTSETTFNPSGTITREEAAVMTSRAAKLCGIDTNIPSARDILSQFYDYITVSPWAESSLAFCCDFGILKNDVDSINPHECVKRAEIAEMLYNMMISAKLV